MSFNGRHVLTSPPYNGLPPNVLNLPSEIVLSAKASVSNGVWTTQNYLTSAVNTMSYSVAPATQIDYARNVAVRISPNTASSGTAAGAGLYAAGSIAFYGRDVFGSTRSEAFALTSLNQVTGTVLGSINFASLDSIYFTNVQFHTASSSARSDVSIYVGVGPKLGLPVLIRSSDAVYKAHIGTLQQLTSSGASSSNNQYAITTGEYHVNGISFTSAHATNTPVQIGYNNLGFRGAVYYGT